MRKGGWSRCIWVMKKKKKRELSVSFPKGARRLIGRCLYLRYFTLTPQLNDPECIVTLGRCALDPLSITLASLINVSQSDAPSIDPSIIPRAITRIGNAWDVSISRRRSKSASHLEINSKQLRIKLPRWRLFLIIVSYYSRWIETIEMFAQLLIEQFAELRKRLESRRCAMVAGALKMTRHS